MIYIMFFLWIFRFGLTCKFRCYLKNVSPKIMNHDRVLPGSNNLVNCLQLISQQVASLPLQRMTKRLMRFQFGAWEITWKSNTK